MKNILKYDKYIYYLVLVLIIGLGLFLRLRLYFQAMPLWWDEMALNTSVIKSNTILDFFKPLDILQVAPPLYLGIVKIFIALFGKSIFVFRLFSILAGCASLFLFTSVLHKVFKNKISILLALFIFAINYPLIYYSCEAKPYIIDVFSFVLIYFLYEKMNFTKIKEYFRWALFFFLMPFFSFPSIIALGAIVCTKFFKTNNKFEKIKTAGLAFILFADVIILWLIERGQYSRMLTEVDDWRDYFINFSIIHFINLHKSFLEYLNFNSLIIFIIFICGIFYALVKRNEYKIFLMLSLLLCYISSLIHVYPFKERTILFLVPIFIVFIANIFDTDVSILKQKSLYYIKSTVIVLIILCTSNLLIHFNKNYSIIGGTKEKRELSKKQIITFLDNYKDGEKLITCEEFNHFSAFYNRIYEYNHKINFLEDIYKPKDIKQVILENKNENLWIVYFVGDYRYDKDVDFNKGIENLLKEENINYEILNEDGYKFFHTNVQ